MKQVDLFLLFEKNNLVQFFEKKKMFVFFPSFCVFLFFLKSNMASFLEYILASISLLHIFYFNFLGFAQADLVFGRKQAKIQRDG